MLKFIKMIKDAADKNSDFNRKLDRYIGLLKTFMYVFRMDFVLLDLKMWKRPFFRVLDTVLTQEWF